MVSPADQYANYFHFSEIDEIHSSGWKVNTAGVKYRVIKRSANQTIIEFHLLSNSKQALEQQKKYKNLMSITGDREDGFIVQRIYKERLTNKISKGQSWIVRSGDKGLAGMSSKMSSKSFEKTYKKGVYTLHSTKEYLSVVDFAANDAKFEDKFGPPVEVIERKSAPKYGRWKFTNQIDILKIYKDRVTGDFIPVLQYKRYMDNEGNFKRDPYGRIIEFTNLQDFFGHINATSYGTISKWQQLKKQINNFLKAQNERPIADTVSKKTFGNWQSVENSE